MSTDTLHLLHTRPNPQALATWAARRRLLDSQGDLGYALHALLHAGFGVHAPQPFRYLDAEQGLLAYTTMPLNQLTHCTETADQEVAAALGIRPAPGQLGINARIFPSRWAAGQALGFEVRVKPVVRENKTGRERDAFLAAIEKPGAPQLNRAAVYVQWLHDQFARQGGATLINAEVTRYQQLGVTRKTQITAPDNQRKSHLVNGPDAVLSGQLRVADPEAFSQLLTKGVGRHRAFGFGMLLLRPVR